jgi:hypothetical protein
VHATEPAVPIQHNLAYHLSQTTPIGIKISGHVMQTVLIDVAADEEILAVLVCKFGVELLGRYQSEQPKEGVGYRPPLF